MRCSPTTLLNATCLAAVILLGYGCSNSSQEPTPAPNADAALFAEITASGYTYFQSAALLPGLGPHGSFKLRFNNTAAAALDSSGELAIGGTFPTGSVIVKEIHSGTTVTLYAVMKKDPSNANAGGGWLWAEYGPSGSVAVSVTAKGTSCVSCHSLTPNRDLSRVFDLH
jgi:Cytochrome P460